jgi:hypothetical protein
MTFGLGARGSGLESEKAAPSVRSCLSSRSVQSLVVVARTDVLRRHRRIAGLLHHAFGILTRAPSPKPHSRKPGARSARS